MATYDVAVIGLGAMGSAAMHALAGRGKRVIGFDQFEPGHNRGSSHGESRIIRLAYFEDPSYVPLVRLAYDAWRRLEAATGEQVLTRTGIVEAGVPGSTIVEASLRSARENDIPHEVLSAARIAERFPALAFPADWTCVFQADGGVLQPEKAVRLFVAGAEAKGAAVRRNTRVAAFEPVGDHVRLRTDAGDVIEAGSVIVSPGAWMGDLVPELKPHLTLTRQLLFWFDPVQPELTGPGKMPVFLFDTGEDVVYGMPDLFGTGVKASSHRHGGVLANADEVRAEPSSDESLAVLEPLRRYVPAAAGPLLQSAACTYTNSPDEHFILGLHSAHPQIVLASPCSGHGFKFASIIGEALADLATTGSTDKPIGLFNPGRFLD